MRLIHGAGRVPISPRHPEESRSRAATRRGTSHAHFATRSGWSRGKRRIRGFIGRASDWRKAKGSSKISTSNGEARISETNRKFAARNDEEIETPKACENLRGMGEEEEKDPRAVKCP